MTDKKTEALKLALEALESCMGVPHWPALRPTITAIREALAQQPAQQDSTCNKKLREQGKAYPRTCKKCGLGPCIADRVQPAQQQEPVAWGWAIMHSDGTAAYIRARVVDFFGAIQERESFTEEDAKQADREWAGLVPHSIVTLYTSPPIEATPLASQRSVKPWVGLTPAEAGALWKVGMTTHEFSCAIEAKLKEKNAAPIQPLTDEQPAPSGGQQDDLIIALYSKIDFLRGKIELLESGLVKSKRTWVGLTDVEWMNIVNKDHAWFGQRPDDVACEVAKLVEAKLKAKNSL